MDNVLIQERWDSDPKEHRRKLARGINKVSRDSVVSVDPNKVKYLWTGTLAEYQAIVTPDDETLYIVVDQGFIYLGGTIVADYSGKQVLGTYDQVADNVATGVGAGSPLQPASNFTNGQYYICDTAGVFSTPIAELNGKTAVTGSEIIAISGVWALVSASQDFISSLFDDSAAGVITFNKPAKGTNPAIDPTDYERKQESDAADSAIQADLDGHKGNTSNPHAVTHFQTGGFDYTNEQITVHKAEQADPDDVHGTKTYTDSQVGPVDADLQAHKAETDIHWSDAPSDGVAYVRQNKGWVPGIEDAPADGLAYVRRNNKWTFNTNVAVLVGPPSNASLGTGGFRLVNWADEFDTGLLEDAANATTGGITIPETGLYNFVAHVFGTQGNDNKEESIWLEAEVVGGPNPGIVSIAHESVDTDKTSDRSLGASGTRRFFAGETLYLRMRASTGLGTFNFEVASFEITRFI